MLSVFQDVWRVKAIEENTRRVRGWEKREEIYNHSSKATNKTTKFEKALEFLKNGKKIWEHSVQYFWGKNENQVKARKEREKLCRHACLCLPHPRVVDRHWPSSAVNTLYKWTGAEFGTVSCLHALQANKWCICATAAQGLHDKRVHCSCCIMLIHLGSLYNATPSTLLWLIWPKSQTASFG